MTTDSPVIIVGAPRSGTSLMQKLIRETPGFVSVPKESDMIWMPYCHPSLNDWKYEGCPDSRITPEAVEDIRTAFSNRALSASTWRLFDRLGLMERPRLAAFLRFAYRTLYAPWSRIQELAKSTDSDPGRLVDKSVHAGLWLNLVDAVFPDARYIHMVRSPETCVPSMIQGWNSCNRFRTYQIPQQVVPPRKDTNSWWCFPMPQDWTNHYHTDLVDLCAFQWNAINRSILDHLAQSHLRARAMQVHLELLCDDTNATLTNVAQLIEVPLRHLHQRDSTVPKVNASKQDIFIDNKTKQTIYNATRNTYLDLVYSTHS